MVVLDFFMVNVALAARFGRRLVTGHAGPAAMDGAFAAGARKMRSDAPRRARPPRALVRPAEVPRQPVSLQLP
jgi:hypothetical protein